MSRVGPVRLFSVILVSILLAAPASAQSSTRQILAVGAGVPGHAGFAFGPFTSLTMNDKQEIVFLSSLRGPRNELKAVVKSSGVSFSVVAFQGLRAPVPKMAYDSFSTPSLNDAGTICFTAGLKEMEGDATSSAIIRVDGTADRAIVTAADNLPGTVDVPFTEFSAPMIDSQGNVLFGARWGGKKPGSGLFLWTSGGLRNLPLPEGFTAGAKDLLQPVFVSHDEAVLVLRNTPPDAALEQFFRAVAIRTFQELKPAPDPAETVQVLGPRPGQKPVQMVLALMEGANVQTALLAGDPSQPVQARRATGLPEAAPLGQIQGQTTSAQGNIIFAATLADSPGDLALFCFCGGQLTRLTSAEEFQPILQSAPGKAILSLTGDSQQTEALIAPGPAEGGPAIYVTSIP